jgi:haloalkane dehalogenase
LAHHIADLVSLLDQLDLHDLTVVGHDWGGPQGVGAALQRKDRVAALVLMNTWLFTDVLGPFHASPLPWTSWHAPLMGQVFMKRFKVLSRSGMFLASQRDITSAEIHGYVHPWDAPHSETVTLTWPRTIPLVEGDRGWADMKMIENRLPELHDVPVQLIWAPEDPVFTIDYAKRLQTLLPHAEEPILFERASHFLQDDRGPDIVRAIVAFLNRKIGARS